jgi:hypothetical protein
VEGVYSPGVYHSQFYWIAPHLRVGIDKVVYYAAYNPEIKRIEYIIGPTLIGFFREHETLYRINAAGAYPLSGEPHEYAALSGRVFGRGVRGDISGAWQAWKASWSAAVRDPSCSLVK